MSESKHTHGPWAIFQGFIVTANPDGSIPLNARIVANLNETIDADARLLVMAPALRDALEAIP